jgi:hypothetical protein
MLVSCRGACSAMAGQPECLVSCVEERDIRVIPLRYPSSRELGERRVGRARVWRDRRDGWCGYRHIVVVGREQAMAG